MRTIYLYLPERMADHETGYLLQGLSMQRMLPQVRYPLRTVGATKAPVRTLGGMTILPDCATAELDAREIAALILPGADTWQEPEQQDILSLAVRLLEQGVPVAAICGATLGLADRGVLHGRRHTSNSRDFLTSLATNYTGEGYDPAALAVADGNLITAGSAGGLLWAKYILEQLQVYTPAVIAAWYRYFLRGHAGDYAALMAALTKEEEHHGI